jgi:hypothetical protein
MDVLLPSEDMIDNASHRWASVQDGSRAFAVMSNGIGTGGMICPHSQWS